MLENNTAVENLCINEVKHEEGTKERKVILEKVK